MANKIFVAVEFRLIVFRPFKNEVMLGRISSATEDVIRVRTQFFDQIFIPFSGLPEGSELYVLLLTYVPYCFALLPPISRRNQRSHSLPSPSPKTNPHPSLHPDQLFVWHVPPSDPSEPPQDLIYDNQETVRFRIEEEIWTDQSPLGPKEKEDALGLTTADAGKSSPYVIRGSMADAGLGPCLWWDGDDEGEGGEV